MVYVFLAVLGYIVFAAAPTPVFLLYVVAALALVAYLWSQAWKRRRQDRTPPSA
ncbi:hypothetical protein [Magnetofaba australis]|uniref:hypothetical protein n=1 Tax=Magnetofaba australis TaxID=1472297 RepID=UPI001301FEED|nr:hypothetical protein [Magnetofaba australis]